MSSAPSLQIFTKVHVMLLRYSTSLPPNNVLIIFKFKVLHNFYMNLKNIYLFFKISKFMYI